MIGKTIAHYRVTDLIGKGGMGEVYRAIDTKLGREVALKVLPAELALDPDRRRRFEKEARAIAALQHPNIVTIYAVDEFGGVPFLTMELVEGRNLSDSTASDGSLESLLRIAVPLTDAVSCAHEKGIAHRDLKPANVMLDTHRRVKVLDFGLAKLFAPPSDPGDDTVLPDATLTQDGTVLGTPTYMSPEQAEGKATDPRSDVFSLGIILYELATGRVPFQGSSSMATIAAILTETPSPITEVRPDLPKISRAS